MLTKTGIQNLMQQPGFSARVEKALYSQDCAEPVAHACFDLSTDFLHASAAPPSRASEKNWQKPQSAHKAAPGLQAPHTRRSNPARG